MINFDFYTPTRVLFGADRENEAGKQVAAFGGHKVMIIYGKKGGHVESSGLLERVHQSLNGAGLSYIDFSGVVPNPRLSLVKEGIRIGSSLKDVTKKYGKAKARFGVYTFKKGSSKLQIMLNGNKVSAIRYFASK